MSQEESMKQRMKSGAWSRSVFMASLLLFATGPVWAQPTVKIGVIAEFSGPFADYGAQILGGMKAYLQQNGDVFGGKKIEIVVKDTTGAAPDIAKRLAQETVTRDNVDILAGFGLTPNALAVAPVATEAKKAMVIMNAATSIITSRSRSLRIPNRWRSGRRRTASSGYSPWSPISARARMRKPRSSRRSRRPAARLSRASEPLSQIPTSRPSSSASRTPSPKRCSSFFHREARPSLLSRAMRNAGSRPLASRSSPPEI